MEQTSGVCVIAEAESRQIMRSCLREQVAE